MVAAEKDGGDVGCGGQVAVAEVQQQRRELRAAVAWKG
jgi:hypothetical protein